MKIKKGDTVIVTSGKDRGKSGTVVRAFPKDLRVLVEGINMVKKHQKARRSGSVGQVIEKPMPIPVSNVSIKDPKGGKPSRIGYIIEGGKKVRIALKSKSKID
jgi:large subunit ribosomal protein L24